MTKPPEKYGEMLYRESTDTDLQAMQTISSGSGVTKALQLCWPDDDETETL